MILSGRAHDYICGKLSIYGVEGASDQKAQRNDRLG